jgi:DNA-binding winged helix-turn-helix (wHTH) protein/tetratricopeptide (TPR) repeat protein
MNRNLIDGPEAGFCFGKFRLEADGTLWCEEAIVHLTPKELAALRILIAHAGRILSPMQLKHALWDDVHVSADSVPKCVSSLRAKLAPHECIQTVYKRGYRFIAEVERCNAKPPGALPRLAILPFVTGYAVPEHLGLALAEETIVRLVNLERPVVAVLARDSVFTLARHKKTAQQVGEALQAGLVLTGTLSAVGAHFRLRAEMIRVEDGTQIWVEDLLVPQAQVARLEIELVQRLLLRMNLGGMTISAAAAPAAERQRTPKQREAWEIYLRGHQEWQSMQRHRLQDALQHLQRALALDPALTPARVDIVNLSAAQSLYGFLPPAEAAALVRRTAEPEDASLPRDEATLPALGWVRFHFDHDLHGALQDFARSAHLPHEMWTTSMRVLLNLSRQRFDDALEILRAALQVDPFSPWLHARLAWTLHLAGKPAESLAQVHQTLSLFPHHEGCIFYAIMILAFNGESVRALQLSSALASRINYFDLITSNHAYSLVRAGRDEEARAILERLQWLSRERFVISSFLPAVYVAMGEPEAALKALRTAHDSRCPWFFQMMADPRLALLHGNPEFERLASLLPAMEASLAQ